MCLGNKFRFFLFKAAASGRKRIEYSREGWTTGGVTVGGLKAGSRLAPDVAPIMCCEICDQGLNMYID